MSCIWPSYSSSSLIEQCLRLVMMAVKRRGWLDASRDVCSPVHRHSGCPLHNLCGPPMNHIFPRQPQCNEHKVGSIKHRPHKFTIYVDMPRARFPLRLLSKPGRQEDVIDSRSLYQSFECSRCLSNTADTDDRLIIFSTPTLLVS